MTAYVEDAFDTQKVRAELGLESTIYLVARAPSALKTLLGYTKLKLGSSIECVSGDAPAQLERIYVDTKIQRGGIGSHLLTETAGYAKSMGANRLWLAVWEKNRKAQRFYERHGFVAVGSTFFVLGPERQSDIVMAQKLR